MPKPSRKKLDLQPGGQPLGNYISPAAVDVIRLEIREAGGNEVFFAGEIGATGLVERVRVLARGHGWAVPAILDGLKLRDVAIHNHPTGNLTPSNEDVELASIFGHHGHGAYIVDNDVTSVYVMVEPFLDKDRVALDPEKLRSWFNKKGSMAKYLPQFEVRPQQEEMMRAVAHAFNADSIVVVEAPTGVGKTLAYLIPAILWGLDNRERIVVSTRTINLQEQIMFKDVPLLQKAMERKFNAVLVKGRSNYVCRRRFERAVGEATLFDEENTRQVFRVLGEWIDKTKDGSKSDLSFVPPRDIWERVCSEGDTCPGQRCQYYGKCFFTLARREMAKADLLVANHHILFSDLALRRETGGMSGVSVLPQFNRVILDEAHSVEDSATEYFGVDASLRGAMLLLSRFKRQEHGQERGLIPTIRTRIMREALTMSVDETNTALAQISDALMPALEALHVHLDTAFAAIREVAAAHCGQTGRDIKWRLTEETLAIPELRQMHAEDVLPAVTATIDVVKVCLWLEDVLRKIKPAEHQPEPPLLMELMQLQSYRNRLSSMASVLSEVTSDELAPNTVRWVEIDGTDDRQVRIARCPLDVGEALAEWVYTNLKTIVMTSATLSVQKSCEYFFNRIGLDRVDQQRLTSESLDSPFDYTKQAVLCLPTDIANPDSREFLEESEEHLSKILAVTKGHALVLFTSFYALDHAFRKIEPQLKAQGVTALKQGGASRTLLLDRFRNDPSSVLFATDSFWEGVDVAGESLQCVILVKLPFRVPTEPIIQARAEAIQAAGGNAFTGYTVPQAVIKFRQGFGRLIRRKSDFGTIVVLDRRVVTKYYGRVFLESLPEMTRLVGKSDEIYGALGDFLRQKREEDHHEHGNTD